MAILDNIKTTLEGIPLTIETRVRIAGQGWCAQTNKTQDPHMKREKSRCSGVLSN